MDTSRAYQAIVQLKRGEIKNARGLLDVSKGELNDGDFVNCLMALDKGLDLAQNGRLTEALPHLQNSVQVVEASSDQELKTTVFVLLEYAYGVTQLHDGDARGALQSLETVSDTLSRLSFFDSELTQFAVSAKAGACVALARASMNAGNVEQARHWFGQTRDQLRQLADLLEEGDPSDAPAWTEVYGLPVEAASLWAMHDLQALDTEQALERLKRSGDDLAKLEEVFPDLTSGPLKDVTKANIYINRSMQEIVEIADRTLRRGERLSKSDITSLRDEINNLRQAKNYSRRAGMRGQGYQWMIDQLITFSRNLLQAQGPTKQDFGKMSGLISFASFTVLLLTVHYLASPSGGIGLGYTFGVLIISLIAGFGYGALKFIPLLQTYKNVITEIPDGTGQ